jgi:hypothetical protein
MEELGYINMKNLIKLLLVAVVVFVLVETNPSKPEYVDWLKQKTMNESSSLLEKGTISLFGKTVFDMGTKRTDYFVFSYYDTDLTDIGAGEVKCIGLFNHFIPVSKKP